MNQAPKDIKDVADEIRRLEAEKVRLLAQLASQLTDPPEVKAKEPKNGQH